jgi:hypothetical protein
MKLVSEKVKCEICALFLQPTRMLRGQICLSFNHLIEQWPWLV